MMKTIDKAIKSLANKASNGKADEALNYSQAVLNLTCAKINLVAHKRDKKELNK